MPTRSDLEDIVQMAEPAATVPSPSDTGPAMRANDLRDIIKMAEAPVAGTAAPAGEVPTKVTPGVSSDKDSGGLVREPHPSEHEFFKLRKDVAGYAADDDRIVINPYGVAAQDPVARQAVILNEATRIHLKRKGVPLKFALTENQKRDFADYSKDENDIRATIVGRIVSGDPSAGDVTPEQRAVADSIAPEVRALLGLRANGTPKGKGYFGELKRPDGGVSTELSIGVQFDGKETEIPSLVPTLTPDEKRYLLSGGKPTNQIVQKAVDHAKKRMAEGKSPFANDEESAPAPVAQATPGVSAAKGAPSDEGPVSLWRSLGRGIKGALPSAAYSLASLTSRGLGAIPRLEAEVMTGGPVLPLVSEDAAKIQQVVRRAAETKQEYMAGGWIKNLLDSFVEKHPDWGPERLESVAAIAENPGAVLENLTAQVPYMGSMMVGQVLGGPLLAGLIPFLVEGQDIYDQSLREAIKAGIPQDEAERRAANAAQIGAPINAAIEMGEALFNLKLARTVKAKLLNRAIGKAKLDAARLGRRFPLTRDVLNAIAINSLQEGFEGMVREGLVDWAAKKPIDFGKMAKQAGLDMVMGGLSAAIMGMGGGAMSAVVKGGVQAGADIAEKVAPEEANPAEPPTPTADEQAAIIQNFGPEIGEYQVGEVEAAELPAPTAAAEQAPVVAEPTIPQPAQSSQATEGPGAIVTPGSHADLVAKVQAMPAPTVESVSRELGLSADVAQTVMAEAGISSISPTPAEQVAESGAEAAQKQPWEMTREEFVSTYPKGAYGLPTIDGVSEEDIGRQFARDEEWSVGRRTGKEILADSDKYGLTQAEHRWIVETAVSKGKPVPRAVLEDYAGEPWADAALAKLKAPPPAAAEAGKVVVQGEPSAIAPESLAPVSEGNIAGVSFRARTPAEEIAEVDRSIRERVLPKLTPNQRRELLLQTPEVRAEFSKWFGELASRNTFKKDLAQAKKRAERKSISPTPAEQVAESGAEAAQKQPWEMTQREWTDAWDAVRADDSGAGRGGSRSQTNATIQVHARLKMGLNPQDPESGMSRHVQHRDVIEHALGLGKPVPPEVLADYPDLAPPPAAAGAAPAPVAPSAPKVQQAASEPKVSAAPASAAPAPPPAAAEAAAAPDVWTPETVAVHPETLMDAGTGQDYTQFHRILVQPGRYKGTFIVRDQRVRDGVVLRDTVLAEPDGKMSLRAALSRAVEGYDRGEAIGVAADVINRRTSRQAWTVEKTRLESELDDIRRGDQGDYETALKKARLYGKASRGEAPQDKIDAIKRETWAKNNAAKDRAVQIIVALKAHERIEPDRFLKPPKAKRVATEAGQVPSQPGQPMSQTALAPVAPSAAKVQQAAPEPKVSAAPASAAPAPPPAAAEAAAQKQPWEMTRDDAEKVDTSLPTALKRIFKPVDWEKWLLLRGGTVAPIENQLERILARPSGVVDAKTEAALRDAVKNRDSLGAALDKQYDLQSSPIRSNVASAVRGGKPVKAAVLRDYAGEPWADAALAKAPPPAAAGAAAEANIPAQAKEPSDAQLVTMGRTEVEESLARAKVQIAEKRAALKNRHITRRHRVFLRHELDSNNAHQAEFERILRQNDQDALMLYGRSRQRSIDDTEYRTQAQAQEGKGGFVADPTVPGSAPKEGQPGFLRMPGEPRAKAPVAKPFLDAKRVAETSTAPEMKSFWNRTARFLSPINRARKIAENVVKGTLDRFVYLWEIPSGEVGAYARDAVRTMQDQVRSAKDKAVGMVTGWVNGDGSRQALDSSGMDLLRRKVFIEDMLHDASENRPLPQGVTVDALKAEQVVVDGLISKVPSVQDAFNRRRQMWAEVSADLARRGVISEENAANETYVRHFVLEHLDDQAYAGLGRRLKKPFRPYGLERAGGFDFSTDLLEVDLAALTKILSDNAIDDMASDIAGRYAITVEEDQPTPDGYRDWQPARGNTFFPAKTITEDRIMRLADAAMQELDEEFGIPYGELRDGLVMGGKKKSYLIPKWLADTLDNLPVTAKKGRGAQAITPFVQAWKRWILRVNPLRYNIRNLIGDAERVVASGYEHAFLRLPEAFKLLRSKTGKYYEALKSFGGIGTSLLDEMGRATESPEFAQLADIKNLKGFKRWVKASVKAARKVGAAGQAVQNLTQFREDLLRVAVYLEAKARVDDFVSGKADHIRFWPGSVAEVEALARQDPARAAVKISRETLGDYGKFTPWENDNLRNAWAPFYSWLKINTTFWPRTVYGALAEGTPKESLKTTGMLALRTGREALRAGKWVARTMLAYAALYAFNHRDDEAKEREKKLPAWIRSKPHITLANGGVIYEPSAMTDWMEWFNIDQIYRSLQHFERGQLSTKEFAVSVLVDISQGGVNKIWQSLSPFVKMPFTMMGYKTYPDVFDAKPFAKAFSGKAVGRAFMDVLGSDVKKFVSAREGNVSINDMLLYYFSGSSYLSPDQLAKQIEAELGKVGPSRRPRSGPKERKPR